MNIKFNIISLFFFLSISVLFSGATYNEYNLPTEENLKLVDFFDKLNGVIVTESGQIYYTNSMAKKWTNVDLKIDYTPEKLIYSNSGEAVIIGSDSTILKSYNYGRDWLILSHDNESEVIFNFIISRNANDYYLTEKGNNNIYYSYDGLNTIIKVNTTDIDRKFRSYPLVYSNKRKTIIFAGGEDYSTNDYVYYKHNLGFFRSNNCNEFSNMSFGLSVPGKPTLNRNIATDLIEIDEQFMKVSNYSINFNEGSYYDFNAYSRDFILKSQDSIVKVKKTGENSFVVLFDNSEILRYDSVYNSNQGFGSIEYKLDSIDLSNKIKYDYEKIGDTNSIVVSDRGNYYLSYDKSTIDLSDNSDNDSDNSDNDSDIIVSDSIDVNEVLTFENFTPNPTNNVTAIVFENKLFVKAIEVYSVEGRLLIKKVIMKKKNTFQLNLKDLQSSNYYIKIITDKGAIYKNIIKF